MDDWGPDTSKIDHASANGVRRREPPDFRLSMSLSSCASVSGRGTPVSTTKSARRRFRCRVVAVRAEAQAGVRRARPLENAGALMVGGRRDHDDRIHVQWRPTSNSSGISSTATASPRPGPRSKRCSASWTREVDDCFQLPKPSASRPARLRASAIYFSVRSRCRGMRPRWAEPPPHRGGVHLGVGIEHRDAAAAEHGRNGRLAHADGTREANDQHHVASMSAAISS